MQKPSVGRIVHYTNGSWVQPAIIVAVHSDDCVNLRVFGDDGLRPLHITSCLRDDDGADGTWRWPPRV